MDNLLDKGKFVGFTLPEGAWLPPELIVMLPGLNQSQLKMLIVIIFRFMQVGGNEATSLTDLEFLTGLSRQSVSTTIKKLLDCCLITRTELGKSYSYEPMVKFLDHQVKSVKRESIKDIDSLSLSLDSLELVEKLRTLGVYVRTAQEIVKSYDEDVIEQQIKYYTHAFKRGLARSPGWLVLSIKKGWGPPLGFYDDSRNKDPQKYRDWER
ncbi:MAG: helix-turn-helix domain-containing protein [Chloroflexota bacterium]|nr:helix-turn-helix domain-containing protein [Chloroflexota bacterium]